MMKERTRIIAVLCSGPLTSNYVMAGCDHDDIIYQSLTSTLTEGGPEDGHFFVVERPGLDVTNLGGFFQETQ